MSVKVILLYSMEFNEKKWLTFTNKFIFDELSEDALPCFFMSSSICSFWRYCCDNAQKLFERCHIISFMSSLSHSHFLILVN